VAFTSATPTPTNPHGGDSTARPYGPDVLDAVYERAVAAGVRIASPIETRAWGERSFYCLDPDSNRLCFVDDSTLFLGHGATWE
jgi:uncharacterized glyoxalase superfamily protein PhnB